MGYTVIMRSVHLTGALPEPVEAVTYNVDPLWHPPSTTDLFILPLSQTSCSDFMTQTAKTQIQGMNIP